MVPQAEEVGGRMHKVVSDSGMLAYLVHDDADKDSDTSSQASVTFPAHTPAPSSLGHSASDEHIGYVPGSGVGSFPVGHAPGGAGGGQHSRHDSEAASGSGHTSPEPGAHASSGHNSSSSNMSNAFKAGLRKLTEPLGGLGVN